VELTDTQRRTLTWLMDPGGGASFGAGVDLRIRERLETGIRPLMPLPLGRLRLTKVRLNLLARCPGLFEAELRGERPPFAHTPASAAGTLAHKSVELDVRALDDIEPGALVALAVRHLERDRTFGPYWEGLGDADRGRLLARAQAAVNRFRRSFPPARVFRRAMAPVTELWMEARFGGGAVSVAGKADLLVNAARPGRSTRLLLDLKVGRPWSEHAEDMRLYALLLLLRTGRPPFRVATFYLMSGEWQAEDVTDQVLDRAGDRIVEAVRTASELGRGGAPELSGGPWCARCPRAPGCPASRATFATAR
jgi:hypothetical protein